MPGRHPGEQLARLRLFGAAVGQQLDQLAGGAAHPPLVLHRDPQIVEDAAQVSGEPLLVRDRAELDVDPRLADRSVAASPPWSRPPLRPGRPDQPGLGRAVACGGDRMRHAATSCARPAPGGRSGGCRPRAG